MIMRLLSLRQMRFRVSGFVPATRSALNRSGIIFLGLNYVLLLFIAIISSIPLLWMLSTSLKQDGKEFLYPPQWIPDPFAWGNYVVLWSESKIQYFALNSFIVVILATIGTLLSASLVAFGFARIEFFGKRVLFILLLSTMMLPSIVTLVPTFILFKWLGWIDTLLPLIVPSWFGGGAFFVFLMRQFMLQLPRELDEAAIVDGASYPRIYWDIIMPLMGPALAAVAIFSFVNHWNEFLHPLVFLTSDKWRTLALALRGYVVEHAGGDYGDGRWNQLMAASTVMLVPVLVVFFSAQKYFIRGISLSGLTGR